MWVTGVRTVSHALARAITIQAALGPPPSRGVISRDIAPAIEQRRNRATRVIKRRQTVARAEFAPRTCDDRSNE